MGTRIRSTRKRRGGCLKNLFLVVLACAAVACKGGPPTHTILQHRAFKDENGKYRYFVDCIVGYNVDDTYKLDKREVNKADWDKIKDGDNC